jgi:Family of unknown function (DUF5681)
MAKRGPKGRFVHGQSGNPGGRPKAEVCLTTLLRAALAQKDESGKRTKAQAVIDALVEMVCDEHSSAALRIMFERIDGILQPLEQGPALDLEAVARAMKAKYDTVRPGGPPARDEG